RSDLFYRLNVFPVVLPPLRERRDDISMLARHFTQRFARRMGRQIESIPATVMEALVQYAWPGNIREMQNVIERAVILSPGTALHLDAAELRVARQGSAPRSREPVIKNQESEADDSRANASLADAEREHILGVLRSTGWVLGGPNGAAVKLAMKR